MLKQVSVFDLKLQKKNNARAKFHGNGVFQHSSHSFRIFIIKKMNYSTLNLSDTVFNAFFLFVCFYLYYFLANLVDNKSASAFYFIAMCFFSNFLKFLRVLYYYCVVLQCSSSITIPQKYHLSLFNSLSYHIKQNYKSRFFYPQQLQIYFVFI